MVPLKLTLKNFLCYRGDVPTLDFEGFSLACLCGQNGHGKSALLDAITWALWGRARTRSDDALIYYGADEMQVELEFQARESRYRVVRRRSRGGGRRRNRGSDLQLQIMDGDDFTPITGNVIRETEARIQQLIGMDYDTFVNSAFLVQGRADEFTSKTAGDRKQVLAKLIGLSEYDNLQELAKERAREKGAEVTASEGRLQHMQQEVSRKGRLQEELEEVEGNLRLIDGQLEAKRAGADVLKLKLDSLRSAQRELQELEARLPRMNQELRQLHQQGEGHRQRIEQYQAAVSDRDSIEAGMRQLATVRDNYEGMNQARTIYDQLNGRMSELSAVIREQRSRLEEQAVGWQWRIQGELQPAVEAVPRLETELKSAGDYLEQLLGQVGTLDAKRGRLTVLTGDVGRLGAELTALETEGKQLGEKLKILQSAGQGSSCPVCGTTMGPDECLHLTQTYDSEIAEKRRLYRIAQVGLSEATKEKTSLETDLSEAQESLQQQRDEAQRTLAALEEELRRAVQSKGDLAGAEEQFTSLQVRLDKGQYAEQEQLDLNQVEAELDPLGYSSEAHQQLYRQLQESQKVEEQHRSLLEAEATLPQEKEALALAESISRDRTREVEEVELKRGAMAVAMVELPQLEEAFARESAGVAGLERSQRSTLQQQGEVEGELRRLEEMDRQLGRVQRGLLQSKEELGLYRELEVAFGRRGIQAMLIDRVLPRIENSANELLGRMTDGRMNLKLETQKEHQNGQGDLIETLEIIISDELGPRPYDLFSGGEAFRINLALRIALSKELAHRHGAPLPTLFIDEGFGTQDAPGRDRILDVISAIEPDFQKIIVITHLEELKDAFPVQIQVEKDENGASVWIA